MQALGGKNKYIGLDEYCPQGKCLRIVSQLSKWTTAKREWYHGAENDREPGVEYRISIAGIQKEIKVNSTVNSKVAGIPSPCVSYQHRWIPENCSSDPDGWCYLCHSLFSFEIQLEQSFASLMRAEKNRTWNRLNFPSLPLQIQNVKCNCATC